MTECHGRKQISFTSDVPLTPQSDYAQQQVYVPHRERSGGNLEAWCAVATRTRKVKQMQSTDSHEDKTEIPPQNPAVSPCRVTIQRPVPGKQ